MNRLPDTEKGSILVWTAIILAVLIAFAGLATDIPYLYVAKRQAQTAADAGAIAGAYGLVVDQAVKEKAKTEARAIAVKTPIIGQFLLSDNIDVFVCSVPEAIDGACASDGTSSPYNQVTTITHRDVAHENPMPLFVLPILQLPIFGMGTATADHSGWDAANVSATATAGIFNTCSSTCFKPWSVPDKWTDTNGNGQYDTGEPYDPATTGYQFPRDANGTPVTLKKAQGNNVSPSFYYAVDFPPLIHNGITGNPVTGANQYEWNIEHCDDNNFVAVGDTLQEETGAMVGPTREGFEALIALDPDATWANHSATSPRMIRIAFFDPTIALQPGRKSLLVRNVGGFFLDHMDGNNVVGYYTQVIASGGPVDPSCTGLQTVKLVK